MALRLPSGRIALSQTLKSSLAARVSVLLSAVGPGYLARTDAGDAYTAVVLDAEVEVLAGTTRDAVLTVTRLR
ncbi:hypothetical protein [Streptomyces sp. NPDC055210]